VSSTASRSDEHQTTELLLLGMWSRPDASDPDNGGERFSNSQIVKQRQRRMLRLGKSFTTTKAHKSEGKEKIEHNLKRGVDSLPYHDRQVTLHGGI
jgi:hypothetical protein